jgi:membrane protease YdiL (CAAX protease family)
MSRCGWARLLNPAAVVHTGSVAEVIESDTASPSPVRERFGLEVLAVLGVSLGMSGVYALLSFVRTQVTVPGGFAHATATVVAGPNTSYQWLDLADDLADVMNGLMPAFLALVLLARTPAGVGLGIGLDRLRSSDVLQGFGFCALIGIPGLGLVWTAHELGLNAQLDVVSLPDVWYRVPLLLLDAAQNGILEEIVVIGFLLTRLRQMGWSNGKALGAAAILRGSYHLYQGYGGFFGNLVMGLIFGWWFQRTRRVLPMVIAHTLLDAFSFVGYIYLRAHISWI